MTRACPFNVVLRRLLFSAASMCDDTFDTPGLFPDAIAAAKTSLRWRASTPTSWVTVASPSSSSAASLTAGSYLASDSNTSAK